MVSQDTQTTLINVAVIVIGSYHLPASVAFGALTGASLFILSRTGYALLPKAWLFAVSFFCGVFGGDDAAQFLNLLIPNFVPVRVNEFTGAVLAAAFAVGLVQFGYRRLDRYELRLKNPAPNHQTKGQEHE